MVGFNQINVIKEFLRWNLAGQVVVSVHDQDFSVSRSHGALDVFEEDAHGFRSVEDANIFGFLANTVLPQEFHFGAFEGHADRAQGFCLDVGMTFFKIIDSRFGKSRGISEVLLSPSQDSACASALFD